MSPQNQQPPHRNDAPFNESPDCSIEIDREKSQQGVKLLLEAVGKDPDEAGVRETWHRRVPEMFETLTEGMRTAEKPTMRTFDAHTDGLVVKTGIPVYSLCEHHILPFYGHAHIAYQPGDEMVGLSKLVRYVRWQSRRLTTQEVLTRDIVNGLATELESDSVTAELTAMHMCEAMRGVETVTTTTTRESVGNLCQEDHQQFRDAVRRERDCLGGTI